MRFVSSSPPAPKLTPPHTHNAARTYSFAIWEPHRPARLFLISSRCYFIIGSPCKILEFLHVKPGKGSAFVRTKVKNLITGNSLEKTFRAVRLVCAFCVSYSSIVEPPPPGYMHSIPIDCTHIINTSVLCTSSRVYSDPHP